MDYFASPSLRTAAAPSGADQVPQAQDGELCSVCPHRVADHDTIGLRFCRATAAGALHRGCVCQ